jgi:pimeloyl-ACP methyl ester carboxylesterase
MQHIVLLHGAIGAKDQLVPLANELSAEFHVHYFSFAGHGGEPMPPEGFSIELFAKQLLDYLDANKLSQVHLFGYSMGGYVAMYLAKHYPERVIKLVTIATKFQWDESIAAREVKMLDPQKLEEKVPAFAKELQQRHGTQAWQTVLQKTASLLFSLGKNNVLKPEDYASLMVPCLLLLGDRDKMVTLEETVAVYKQLSNARLGVLPATPHPLEQVNVKRLGFEIRQFMS